MFDLDPAAPNIVPSRYRHVALSTDLATLDPDGLVDHFTGKEAYYRTRYIVARDGTGTALVEVDRPSTDGLFSTIEQVRVLASAQECVYVIDPDIDVGVPSSLATVARRNPDARCVVVEGRYSHVSFLLNPDPLPVLVLDVVPPFPSKLLDQVQRVLAVAEDLPPIVVVEDLVDSRAVLAADRAEEPDRILVPCRGSGLDFADAQVRYLDERPAHEDWVLLGCERSQQIHTWFYGTRADLVDTCPRRFLGGLDSDGAVLTRCCMLQEGMEHRGGAMQVPWGASLDEVRTALMALVAQETEAGRFRWAPT